MRSDGATALERGDSVGAAATLLGEPAASDIIARAASAEGSRNGGGATSINSGASSSGARPQPSQLERPQQPPSQPSQVERPQQPQLAAPSLMDGCFYIEMGANGRLTGQCVVARVADVALPSGKVERSVRLQSLASAVTHPTVPIRVGDACSDVALHEGETAAQAMVYHLVRHLRDELAFKGGRGGVGVINEATLRTRQVACLAAHAAAGYPPIVLPLEQKAAGVAYPKLYVVVRNGSAADPGVGVEVALCDSRLVQQPPTGASSAAASSAAAAEPLSIGSAALVRPVGVVDIAMDVGFAMPGYTWRCSPMVLTLAELVCRDAPHALWPPVGHVLWDFIDVDMQQNVPWTVPLFDSSVRDGGAAAYRVKVDDFSGDVWLALANGVKVPLLYVRDGATWARLRALAPRASHPQVGMTVAELQWARGAAKLVTANLQAEEAAALAREFPPGATALAEAPHGLDWPLSSAIIVVDGDEGAPNANRAGRQLPPL